MPTNCIEWPYSRNIKDGNRLDYGQVRVGAKMQKAHRVAWEKAYGSIPNGMLVLHTCDNPPCVNPEHLYLGTHSDNALDRERRGRGRNSAGAQNGNTIISEQTTIRLKMLDGVLAASACARAVGISAQQAWMIMKGKYWKHVSANTRYA